MTVGLQYGALIREWGLRPHTAQHVARLAEGHTLRVTSGLRTPGRNAAVGGARNSLHLTGRAVDLVSDTWTLDHLRAEALRAGAAEALLEYRGTPREHLHLAW